MLARARGLLRKDVAISAVVAAAQESRTDARATTGLVVDAQSGLPPPPVVSSPEDLGDCIDCSICVQARIFFIVSVAASHAMMPVLKKTPPTGNIHLYMADG